MDAINVPSPPRLVPKISASTFSVKPDSKRAAGTLLITWLEITAVNNVYLKRGKLNVERLGRGYAWLDTGTPDSMLDAGNFIKAVETRQGLQVACLEEIAFCNNWLTAQQALDSVSNMKKTEYARYLEQRVKEWENSK